MLRVFAICFVNSELYVCVCVYYIEKSAFSITIVCVNASVFCVSNNQLLAVSGDSTGTDENDLLIYYIVCFLFKYVRNIVPLMGTKTKSEQPKKQLVKLRNTDR